MLFAKKFATKSLCISFYLGVGYKLGHAMGLDWSI